MAKENDAAITYETIFEILRREKNREELQKLESGFYSLALSYIKNLKVEMDNLTRQAYSDLEVEKFRIQISNIKRMIIEIYNRREKKILNMAMIKTRSYDSLISVSSMLENEKELFNCLCETLLLKRRNGLINFEKNIDAKEIINENVSFINSYGSSSAKKEDKTEKLIDEPESKISNKPLDKIQEQESSEEASEEAASSNSNENNNPSNDISDNSPQQIEKQIENSVSNLVSNPVSEEIKSNALHEGNVSVILPPLMSSLTKNETSKVRIKESLPKFVGPNLEIYGPYSPGDVTEVPSMIAKVLIDKGSAQAE